MARVADHEGLAPLPQHERHPWGLGCVLFETGEVADLVNKHLARLPAQLAPSSKQPADQLLPLVGDLVGRSAVDEDRPLVSHQGYPAEPRDQWLLAIAFDPGFVAPA
nr:hypothetical protein [Ferrimicrobium acidiphilum]